jgi:hypothetical protein
MKQAYDVRSGVVHAGTESAPDEGEGLAQELQDVLRRCIRRVLGFRSDALKQWTSTLKNYQAAESLCDLFVMFGNVELAIAHWGTKT